MTVLLHITGRAFTVRDAEIVPLEARLLHAVRSGGRFLDLVDTVAGPVRVLVTAASVVWWQQPLMHAVSVTCWDACPDVVFIDIP